MGKTFYVICAVNMVASAFAIFLIFRSPPKAKAPRESVGMVAPGVQAVAQPAPDPEATWAEFEQATHLQTAAQIISKLPNYDSTISKVAAYVINNKAPTPEYDNFAQVARVAAGIQFLATYISIESPYLVLLETIAKDHTRPVILRDLALRGVIDAALRKNAGKEGSENGWRAQLETFLTGSDFGAETSMEGLALQAAIFARNHDLISLDINRLTKRVERVLRTPETVDESTLIAALEVCGLIPDANLAEVVRPILKHPRSDAVLQMAVATLGKVGQAEDRDALARLRLTSPALYRTTETAWLTLNTRTQDVRLPPSPARFDQDH